MRVLRALFTGALAVLFSGVLAPITLLPPQQHDVAEAVSTAGLDFTAYRHNSSSPTRSTSMYAVCATGTVSTINWNVGNGDIHGCGSDYVMVRYYGYISYPTTQTVYFRGFSDDGISLKIGTTQVVDEWVLRGCGTSNYGSFTFTANVWYPVEVWMYEAAGGACAQIVQSTSPGGTYSAVPSSQYDRVGIEAAAFTDESVVSTARRDVAYSDSVVATGDGTISYSLQSGALPSGLTLNSASGAISGTPTSNGVYSFTVRATAVSGSSTTVDDTSSLTITVGVPPESSDVDVSSTVNHGTAVSLSAAESTGFPAPSYSIAAGDGSLPAGLSLNSSTGAITGTPTGSGPSTFRVTATNVFG